jgi:NAD(P)-dependent dehydrogenase (short-subunit alcohol dehydrogenase family)
VNAARRALVTGGSAGLGAAFVRWLAANGFDVVSLDRDPPRQQSDVPAAAPVSGGGSIAHIQCDLSDRAQLDAALDDLIAAAPFDLVILNAGISATGRFEEIELAAQLDVVRVNAEAPMIIAARLLGETALVPGAAMGFVSSLSHFTGYPGAASYAASKDALAVFAKGMRT